MGAPVLEVHGLVREFGRLRAVDTVTFHVDEGEIFGLIGPNGAGKTTTLRVVATLLQPTAGRVSVFGRDIVHDAGPIRHLISYLPEEAGAYRNLSGLKYLQFMAGFYARGPGQRREMVTNGLAIAELGDRIKSRVSTYSKGMVRKLLVARALMHRPKLAILDEPTSGLDVINSLEVRRIIKDLARTGITVLLSSHNMLEVEFLSDRVALIDKGRILEAGRPDELKAKYRAANLEEVFTGAVK